MKAIAPPIKADFADTPFPNNRNNAATPRATATCMTMTLTIARIIVPPATGLSLRFLKPMRPQQPAKRPKF